MKDFLVIWVGVGASLLLTVAALLLAAWILTISPPWLRAIEVFLGVTAFCAIALGSIIND